MADNREILREICDGQVLGWVAGADKNNMADDREVLREIWDGRIPVCFNLSSEEIATVEQPEPYYVSLA